MNDHTSGTTPKTDPKTDWRRLRSMTDEEIHAAIIEDPDAKAADEGFWKEAHVVMPRRKETVTMRLDADLLECSVASVATKRGSTQSCGHI